jgi:4-amino-4-deoxy-L-arabinose transferase-like glycosyltransferase
LTLAFLTKSIASLLFLPAVLALTFYFKKTKTLFITKWFYAGFVLFMSVSISFILLRDVQNSGYISYILNNDVNRINNVIESHKEPFDFYFNNLFNYRFVWFLLVLPGIVLLWINKKHKHDAIFISLLFTAYFLIISISKTKLEWYDLPLFPLLSVCSAYLLNYIYSKTELVKTTISSILFLCFVFSIPCYFSFRKAYKSEINPLEKKLEILTEYAFKNSKDNSLNGVVFLTPDFDRALYFYKYKLNTKGLDFTIQTDATGLKNNSTVIVANDSLKYILISNYNCKLIDSINSAVKINITTLK